MPGLIVVALGFIWAITEYVSPAAQSTALVLVAMGIALGIALKIRTGSVW